ncbi:hypothetical protein PARHAE_00867 [Paracoccus haematequi]|uniref:Uncharacterized protein n=1 Tax=Paracoccus haematequi TaxID=2491866 RepID=A0A447IJQ5_9RHOB|nr:hypothetical protein [Paracoccus haematequi]VDS07689.1 hypothetical protein PARHAE_00867 [Paracoccus haematequi]
MVEDSDLDLLYEEFPELEGKNIIIEKEVLAHFGLLFSGYALLEAGLQNCFIFWKLCSRVKDRSVSDGEQWKLLYDSFEHKAQASTFGALLRLLEDCTPLLVQQDELKLLKRKRDYFAHHFFREENKNMFSSEVKILLISRMNVLRRRVKASEEKVDVATLEILKDLYPKTDVIKMIDGLADDLKSQAMANPPTHFGWEKY